MDLGGCLNCKSSLEHPIFCGFGWLCELQIFIKNPIFCDKLATTKKFNHKTRFCDIHGIILKVVLFMWDKNNELLKKRVDKQKGVNQTLHSLRAIT